MAVRMFAAIEVGSFELEMGIYEISGKNRIRQVDHCLLYTSPSPRD